MHEHYYSEQPQSKSAPSSFRVSLRARELSFQTDHGVFSRLGIDAGTRLLIESLPENPSGTLLDLGCGYGAVGIAMAASSPGLQVWMVEVNSRAVELARRNAAQNQVDDRVEVVQSDGFSALPAGLGFDMIALNPPIRAGKQMVFGLYEEAFGRLQSGGLLYVVIQKKQGAESSERRLLDLGYAVDEVTKAKGYRVYACKK